MAGALGLKLNGPRSYRGVMSTDAYMGDGKPEAEPSDITRALTLAKIAWVLLVTAILAVLLILRG